MPAQSPEIPSVFMGLLPLILISVGVIGFMLYKNWSQKRQKQTGVAAPSSFRQSGGFDFRKLAGFIMVLGIIGLVYGFIQFSGNEPEQHVQASPTPDHGGNIIAGNLDALNRSMQAQDANIQIDSRNYVHAQAQDTAKKFMLAGGVILFIGIGISASARK